MILLGSFSQVWRRILLGSNVVLFFLLLFLILKRAIWLDDGSTTGFVRTGEVIAELLNPHGHPSESLLIRERSGVLVLLFLQGLTKHELASFLMQLEECDGAMRTSRVKFIVVCDTQAECDELLKNRLRSSIEGFVDHNGIARARLGVRDRAAIIVDARKLSVTQAFAYLPNPYVLCEQITIRDPL